MGAACLPDDSYQRFQLLPELYQRFTWIYERIHYDPKPIDVAIVGPSKTFMGVSAEEVERRLAILAKPANVANFSLIFQGRNAQWAILDEVYKAKKPRILIVQFDQETAPWGHPWFRYFAPSGDVAFTPSLFLHNYFGDLSFLPFRQMELFVASLFPNMLGFRAAFDPARYAKARTDFTTSYRGLSGEVVDMDREHSAAELRADHEDFEEHLHVSRLPHVLAPFVEADDHLYLDKIARLAADNGATLLMVYVPDFDSRKLDEKTREYYARYGAVLDFSDLAARNALYMHWAHLNHAGAMALSDRLADEVAARLSSGAIADRKN